MAREFDLVIKALAERYPAHLVELVRGKPVAGVERVEKEAVAANRTWCSGSRKTATST